MGQFVIFCSCLPRHSFPGLVAQANTPHDSWMAVLETEWDPLTTNSRQYVQAGRAYCTAGCWRGSAATRGAIKAAACSQIGRRIAGFLRDNASSDLALAASEKPTTLMGPGWSAGITQRCMRLSGVLVCLKSRTKHKHVARNKGVYERFD